MLSKSVIMSNIDYHPFNKASKPWLSARSLLVDQSKHEVLSTMFREDSQATHAWKNLVSETCGPIASVILKTAQDCYVEAANAFKKKHGQLTGKKSFFAIDNISDVLSRSMIGSNEVTYDPEENPALAILKETVEKTSDSILAELFKRTIEVHPLVCEALYALAEKCDEKKAEVSFKNLFFMRFVNVVLVAPDLFGLKVANTDLKILKGYDEESFNIFLCAVSKDIMACTCKPFTIDSASSKSDRYKLAVIIFVQKIVDHQAWLNSKKPSVDLRSVAALARSPQKQDVVSSSSTNKKIRRDPSKEDNISAFPPKAIECLPEGKSLRDLDCVSLCKVLYSLRIYDIIQKIYDADITGDQFRTKDDAFLKDLGVTKRYQRERLLELQKC